MKSVSFIHSYLFFLLFYTYHLQAQIQLGQDIYGEYEGDRLGTSVALNKNGTRVAVGSIYNSEAALFSGKVNVFDWESNEWILVGDGIRSDIANDGFGADVSLSENGEILAVSSMGIGNEGGYAKVYTWNGIQWEQLGQTLEGHHLDCGISLSADGKRLAYTDGNALTVFEFSNGSWDPLGASIQSVSKASISANGTVVAGISGVLPNILRVYKFEDDEWQKMGQDISSGNPYDISGDIELSADGKIVVCGYPLNETPFLGGFGLVKVFSWNGATWKQMGQDIHGDDIASRFGRSVSISNAGDIITIGAPGNNDSLGIISGQASVFKWEDPIWKQLGENIYAEGEGDYFGTSISIASDGSAFAVGGPLNSNKGYRSGFVKIFRIGSSTSMPSPNLMQAQFKVKIYPNPSSGILHFENLSPEKRYQYSILNLKGKVLQSGIITSVHNQIQLADVIPTGAYFLSLYGPKRIVRTFPFIRE